jgi:hypothetical protein
VEVREGAHGDERECRRGRPAGCLAYRSYLSVHFANESPSMPGGRLGARHEPREARGSGQEIGQESLRWRIDGVQDGASHAAR